uniref:Myelin basic protein n=1 Tax=Oryzias latipes TaxID=8090 RepID=H2N2H9_ORYLA
MYLTQTDQPKTTGSVNSMGQQLGKRESPTNSKASSPEPRAAKQRWAAETEPQDEVFGPGETDALQNNGCVSEKPVVTDSTGAEGPHQPRTPASTADPDAATPRPHLVRLFSRDAPGREDNTFKERPSESDELQTIQEHSGAASEESQKAPVESETLPTCFHYHGICKQLRSLCRLRARPEEEEPRALGPDRELLWRRQEEEGKGLFPWSSVSGPSESLRHLPT